MHVGISDILRERNELAAAKDHLETAGNSGAANSYRQYPYRSKVVMAGIRHAEGDAAGAIQLLDEAEIAYVGEFSPDVRPVAALRARMWIAEGELSQAWAWAREQELSTADDPTYLHEFELATLARLLVAEARHGGPQEAVHQAVDLAARLVVEAEKGERNGSLLDALVVLALAHHAGRDAASAIASINRAATLAEPEGYVRVFLDDGRPMSALLKLAMKQPNPPAYLRRLHAAAVGIGEPARPAQRLIEPLSERELDVLRLLGTELDGPEIARELVVSLSTVRTHTQNIYTKLGVNNRRAAVRRGQDLDLLRASGR